MVLLDHLVLLAYFAVLIGIGVYSARRIHAQEDFFMGGRRFGKLVQTFAAFGAGTGSSDPVNTARTTFTSGMSGMWSVMYWLFVTPFYWIAGVWYRRMRHLTLGDWYVERYESRAMGAAYTAFALVFQIVYGSMLFSAIGKVAAPLIGTGTVSLFGTQIGLEYVLVPVIGVVVLVYGVAGGLRAAYLTDLVQGVCIIALSVLLIPFGLRALVEQFGDPSSQGLLDGFRVLHQQVSSEDFRILGRAATSEFPLHRIVAVVLINLIGVVVQPHFIATGGGSARTEMSARVGVVLGNFLKRFCTIGWTLTALIALALFANSAELVDDPDKTWGVASRALLGPGLTGLMLACLLAALMSSVDAYMVVGSGLVVRNVYAAYVNPNASEKEYVKLARWTGVCIVAGAVTVSLLVMDVFRQLQLTWIVPILFAAPFWVGMYWRRATTGAAWGTVSFCALFFFVLPSLLPVLWPGLRTHPSLAVTNDVVMRTETRVAAPADARRRAAAIALWDEAQARLEAAWAEYLSFTDAIRAGETLETSDFASTDALRRYSRALDRLVEARADLSALGPRPSPIDVGDAFSETYATGGRAVFWSAGVSPVDDRGNVLEDVKRVPVGEPREVEGRTTEVLLRYPEGTNLRGSGSFQLEFLLYQWLGFDLRSKANATLGTLELPPKIVAPFVVMIALSFLTRRNSERALNRYYAKMKVPVDPDPQRDRERLEEAYRNPALVRERKLFPSSNLEFQRPTVVDVVGFVVSFIVCFAIIAVAVWVARIGGPP